MRSLAQKLRSFIEKLSTQSNVYVKEKTFHPGASEAQLKNVWPYLPEDARAFYKEMNGLTFEWHFADQIKDGVRRKNTGADFEGRIRLNPLNAKSAFRKNDPAFTFPKDLNFLMLDIHVPEAIGFFVFHEKNGPSVVFAKSAEEGTPKKFGSFTEYIERGIENAFGWYWPFKEPSDQASSLMYKSEGKWGFPLEYEVALSDFSVITGDQYREQALSWKATVAKKYAKALGLKTSLAAGPLNKSILEATKDIDALNTTTIRALAKATMSSGNSLDKLKAALREYFKSPPPASIMAFSVSLHSTEKHPGERVLQPYEIARILSSCPQASGLEILLPDLPGYDEDKEKSFPFTTEPRFPRAKGTYTFQAKLPVGHIPEKDVKYTISFV